MKKEKPQTAGSKNCLRFAVFLYMPYFPRKEKDYCMQDTIYAQSLPKRIFSWKNQHKSFFWINKFLT